MDSGYLLGDCVWEGIRLHKGTLIHLDDHLDRLFSGAKSIARDIGVSQDEMAEALLKTINKNEQAIIFVIWVLFPYSWIWQGDPRASMFQYDLAYVINFFFDIFNNHVDSSTIWPFERIKLDLKKFEIF